MSTHPDYDHVGACADSEIPTYSVNLEGFREDYDWEKVKDKNIPLNQPIYSESGVTVTFLGPVDGNYGEDDTNNYSIVTKIICGNTSYLIPGDCEKEGERALLESGADLSAEVLLVGHHGAATATSKEFLEAVSPFIAVISCGKDNRYGHPKAETLTALTEAGVAYYRTDKVGTIEIASDGTAMHVQSQYPEGAQLEQPTAPPEVEGKAEEATEYVYVTKTGEKYHRAGCIYLRESKIRISIEEAKKKYSPCSVCLP